MLGENIRILRKNKGMTQEELSQQLHVVRQTVGKWEKGLSVPDAALLQQLAEILDTDVSHLLGAPLQPEAAPDTIAVELASINRQLAIQNRRRRKIWRIVGSVVLALILLQVIVILLSISLRIEGGQAVETQVFALQK